MSTIRQLCESVESGIHVWLINVVVSLLLFVRWTNQTYLLITFIAPNQNKARYRGIIITSCSDDVSYLHKEIGRWLRLMVFPKSRHINSSYYFGHEIRISDSRTAGYCADGVVEGVRAGSPHDWWSRSVRSRVESASDVGALHVSSENFASLAIRLNIFYRGAFPIITLSDSKHRPQYFGVDRLEVSLILSRTLRR